MSSCLPLARRCGCASRASEHRTSKASKLRLRGLSKKKKHAYVVDDRRIDVGGLEEVDDSAGRLYAVRGCERSLL